MKQIRRMGPRDSAVSTALLDATERVLREHGYAAASSRRIADEAQIKQNLVYYYFDSMDDLLIATFRRRADRALQHFEELGASADQSPIRMLWNTLNDGLDVKLVSEYVALANHNENIAREVAQFMGAWRTIQAKLIAPQFRAELTGSVPITPLAMSFMIYSLTWHLARERSSGIDVGHDDVQAFIDWMLQQMER